MGTRGKMKSPKSSNNTLVMYMYLLSMGSTRELSLEEESIVSELIQLDKSTGLPLNLSYIVGHEDSHSFM